MTETTTVDERREAARLKLLCCGMPPCPRRAAAWPDDPRRRWTAEPWPTYSAAQQAAIATGRIVACLACGAAVVDATPDATGWTVCGPCADAQARHPAVQPAPVLDDDGVVPSGQLARAEAILAAHRDARLEQMRLARSTPAWLLAAAGTALGLDAEALARVVARPGKPDNEQPVPALSPYRRVDGATPAQPVRPWSHLAVVANVDQADHYRLRVDGRWRRCESQRDVLVAELRLTRDRLEARRVVGPPDGSAGCWACGLAAAPRSSWAGAWCGTCPMPPLNGDRVHHAPDAITHALRAGGIELVYAADRDLAMACYRSARFRYFDEVDGAKPGKRPFAYLSALELAVIDAWMDRVGENWTTGAMSDEQRAARDAGRADRAQLLAEAQRSAETAARETATETVVETSKVVGKAIAKAVGEEVGKVVAGKPAAKPKPAAKATGPTVTPGPAFNRRRR